MPLRHWQHGLSALLCCTPALLCAQVAVTPLVLPAPIVTPRLDAVALPALQTTAQWEPLAALVMQQTLPQLQRHGVHSNTSVYVVPPSAASPLETALHAFLVEQLVQSGAKVLDAPQHARLQVSLQARPLVSVSAPSGDLLLTSQVARGDRVLSSYSQLYTVADAASPWWQAWRAPTMYPISVWKVTNQ